MKLAIERGAKGGGIKPAGIGREPAVLGVGRDGDIKDFARLALQPKRHGLGVVCGEDQWRAIHLQHGVGGREAIVGLGIGGVQRGCLNGLDRRKRGDENGLHVAEGGGRVEPQLQVFALWRGEGWHILEVRHAHGAQEARDVEHGANIGAIGAPAHLRRGAQLGHQVGRCPRAEGSDDGIALAVVQHQGVLILHQTGGLKIRALLEAAGVELDAEGAGEIGGNRLKPGGVVPLGPPHCLQVGIETSAIEPKLVQILGGAHEGAGLPTHRVAQGVEIRRRMGRQEDKGLLGPLGDAHLQFALAAMLPGLQGEEPALRRRVGGAAQKRDHQDIAGRLAGG